MKPLDTNLARKRLGERAAELRKKKKMTQRHLSKICGTHHIDISKFEHGRINLTIDKLAKIADALDCHIDLIEGKNYEGEKTVEKLLSIAKTLDQD